MIQDIIIPQICFARDKWKSSHTGRALCFGNAVQGDHCVVIQWSKILYYLRLAWPRKNIKTITPYMEAIVFWKRHIGGQLCCDLMTQNLIIPQIGLAQDEITNNAVQGGICVLEMSYRGTIVFWTHDLKYYTTSDWLGQGHIYWKRTPSRKATVCWKRHTGEPLSLDPMI